MLSPNFDILTLASLNALSKQPFVLPDIIFLPNEAEVWALDEPVAEKPRLAVSARTVSMAREAT